MIRLVLYFIPSLAVVFLLPQFLYPIFDLKIDLNKELSSNREQQLFARQPDLDSSIHRDMVEFSRFSIFGSHNKEENLDPEPKKDSEFILLGTFISTDFTKAYVKISKINSVISLKKGDLLLEKWVIEEIYRDRLHIREKNEGEVEVITLWKYAEN